MFWSRAGRAFIGSFLVERLRKVGHTVSVVDSLEPRVHYQSAATIPDGVHIGRVNDIPWSLMAEAEVVVHLAAQVGVADSMKDPMRYLNQNTDDTALMLLDMDRHFTRQHLKRLVVASSMSIYGEGGVRVREDAPVVPASVYGMTKYDQERLCLMWGQRKGIPTAALRFFNVYGPRQALNNPYTGVLANFARKYLHDEPPVIYEDGEQTRDFIYVDDVVWALIVAVHSDAVGAFNVCTGEPTTIYKAAKILGRALSCRHIEPEITNTPRAGDIRHCTGDPTKAAEQLDFTAQVPFERGIERYAEWLKEQPRPWEHK